jgi:hypothetical protein
MTQEHPITPPPELLDQWLKIPEVVTPITKMAVVTVTTNRLQMLATEAARWGSDQELEACCEHLEQSCYHSATIGNLRAARRPKPPNLKEQALGALYAIATGADDTREFHQDLETIKQALESLPD